VRNEIPFGTFVGILNILLLFFGKNYGKQMNIKTFINACALLL
jgi:hypothetical protein